MMYSRQIVLVIALMTNLAIQSLHGADVPSLNGRKVVLMSMDGFRYDYLNKTDTPTFDELIASGVKVPYVKNIFASKTFPCHYTIVTGLYEESHGILDNNMYDPVLKETFRLGNVETQWWDGAEPIWINAVKSGLKVGTYFWPGSEAMLQNRLPTSYRPYDGKVTFEERVDTLVEDWLSKKDYDFGIIYFNEPDHSGHKYGPDDPKMIPVIKRMDRILRYFMQKLSDANLKDKVDFILTSDHGMTNIDQKNRLISIQDHVNSSLLDRVVGGGAFANLIPHPGKEQDVVDALSGIDHIQVYLKKNIPEEYHHKNHRRVHPVLVVADDGWEIRKTSRSYGNKGGHGYSNATINMRPIFIASGPSFKKGAEMDPIQSVDIYPLLCHLLNLSPAPNNGSFDNVKAFLTDKPRTFSKDPNAAPTMNASFCSIVSVAIFAFLQFWFP